MSKYMSALPFGAADLLNWAHERFQIETDAELSRLTGIPQPTISKMRHGRVPTNSTLVLELLNLSNLRLRDLEKSVAESKRMLDAARTLGQNEEKAGGIP